MSGFFKSRPYRNFNPHRLHERGICPITRDCSCFHKCGVTKLHFISPVHSCFIHFEANLTPHVYPSLGEHPSLKQPGNVDVTFSVVSNYCQTTVNSNGSGGWVTRGLANVPSFCLFFEGFPKVSILYYVGSIWRQL